MSQYGFASSAIDADDGWVEVWPAGVAQSREMHLRSWPSFASFLKANEYLDALGRVKKFRKIVDVQEDLQRRFDLIQAQVWALSPTDLPRAVKLAPLPNGTVFTKETVRADYTVIFGVRTAPTPLAADQAATLTQRLSGASDPPVSTSVILGHPAFSARTIMHDETGQFSAAQRSMIIAPTNLPVYVELQLRTEFEDQAADIDRTLAHILDRAQFELID